MKATLFTPNYVINDLERVDSFNARRGEKFSISLLEAGAGDVFTNNDPSLSVTTDDSQQAGQLDINIEAKENGLTRLQVRAEDGSLVKEWFITVYNDEAASLSVSAQVSPKD